MHEHDAHQPRPAPAGTPGATKRALAAAEALGIDHTDLLGLLEGNLPTSDFVRVMGKVSTHAELSAWVIAAKQDRVALRQLGAAAAPAALSAALRDLMPAAGLGAAGSTATDAAAQLRLVGTEAAPSTTGLRQWNREEVVPLWSRVPRVSRKFWSHARVALAAGLGIAACVGLYVAGTTIRDRFSPGTPGIPGIAGTHGTHAGNTENTTPPADGIGTLAANNANGNAVPDVTNDDSRLAIADRAGSLHERVSVFATDRKSVV